MNPYKILKIKRTATQKQIRNAYLRLAKIHHPDTENGDNEDFLLVQKAYIFLSDGLSRAKYDETGIWIDPLIAQSSKINTPTEESIEIISGILEGLLEANTSLGFPIDELQSAIKRLKIKIQEKLQPLEKKKYRANMILKKYKLKNKSNSDLIEILLQRKLILIEDLMKPDKQSLEACDLALEIINDYEDLEKFVPSTKTPYEAFKSLFPGPENL